MKKVNSREEYLFEVGKLLPSQPICIELGVEKGYFSKMMLTHLEPKKLYLVDPWEIGFDKNADETYGDTLNNLSTAYSTVDDYQHLFNELSNEIKSKQVVLKKNYSYEVVNTFKDEYFDFIYIDSCHLYPAVKNDLNIFLPKLKKGGIMAGHDYFEYDNFGVIEAVDEFCTQHNYEMIILNNDGFDWALLKKN